MFSIKVKQALKVLILTGRFGLGHIKCAESIKEMILKKDLEASVEIIDLIDYLFPRLNKVIYGNFKLLVSKFYHLYNISTKIAGKYGKVPVGRTICRKMDSLMDQYQPDLVVANLPACAQYYDAYARARDCQVPLFIYVTDITFHDEWVTSGDADYFVGDISTKETLMTKGIDPLKIHVTGIPVTQRFRPYDQKKKGTIFVMGGGLGQLPCGKELLATLDSLKNNEVLLVCGSNQSLYNMVKSKYRHIKAFGLTDQVPEMMNQADIIITKPGGITTFEAIKSQTPLLVIAPKLEQEIGNAHFIEEKNIGKVLYNGNHIDQEIEKFVNDKELLKTMRQNMKALSEGYEDANPLHYLEVDP